MVVAQRITFITTVLGLLSSLQLFGVDRPLGASSNYTRSIDVLDEAKEPYTDVHRLLFVHVGKAGGETVRYSLRAGCQAMRNKKKRQRCEENVPQSALSDRVAGLIHVKMRTVPLDEVDGYLIVIRNPLDRALSWYRYTHPDACNTTASQAPSCYSQYLIRSYPEQATAMFYHDCFPQVSNLTQPAMTDDCRSLLSDVWSGSVAHAPDEPTFWHMIQNTVWYANEVGLHTPVYVIRTEHLWDDMKSLDETFGGDGTFGDMEGLHFTHGVLAKKDDLPAEGRRQLCCWMEEELFLYQKLLFEAENLYAHEAQSTWEAALERCGVSTLLELQESCDWKSDSERKLYSG